MKVMITIFMLVCLKFVASTAFIDIKANTLSPSIKVYHGTFMTEHKYTMLVGYEEPITQVKYGNMLVSPGPSPNGSEYYIVELFNFSKSTYVIITEFSEDLDAIEHKGTQFWKSKNDQISEITKHEFLGLIPGPVYLHVDIGSGFKHPFIEATVSHENDGNVTYNIANHFYGLKINQPRELQYRFGPAYDSTMDIMIGFKIFDEFMKSFDYMIATYV